MDIARGHLVFNVKTGDYGISTNAPALFAHINAIIVPVLIAGAPTTQLWHMPDIAVPDTPYRCLSVGDMVLIDKGRRQVWMKVAYIWRKFGAINVGYKGHEYLYKGVVHCAIPAKDALAIQRKGA